jgi:putative phosphoribosyl transferase
MSLPFKDRSDAGRQLATKLAQYRGNSNVVVLALPRGGVPVAFQVAEALDAPLDVFLVRKLGVPGHEELAIGAIASGGVRVLNQDVLYTFGLTERAIDAIVEREQRELERRERAYRAGRRMIDVEGRLVLLVDDGLATGATMLAAARAIRRLHPQRLVVAVPVAAPESCNYFRGEVDDIVCAETPRFFRSVGLWYEDFSQTTDEEVRELLARTAGRNNVHAS